MQLLVLFGTVIGSNNDQLLCASSDYMHCIFILMYVPFNITKTTVLVTFGH